VNNVPLIYFLALFPSPLGWALVSTLDPFKAFHLGLPHLHLCAQIPLALKWEVQLFFWLSFDHLACEPFNVLAWHIFLLFLQWCIFFPCCGGAIAHKDIKDHLWYFLVGN